MTSLVCFHLHVMVTHLFRVYLAQLLHDLVSVLNKRHPSLFLLLHCLLYIIHFQLDKIANSLFWICLFGYEHAHSPLNNFLFVYFIF